MHKIYQLVKAKTVKMTLSCLATLIIVFAVNFILLKVI